jgi:hypothetical protein
MEYTGRNFFKASETGRTQAKGAFTIDCQDALYAGDQAKDNFTIQFVVSGTTTAGTAKIGLQLPGASSASDIETVVDLAAGPLVVGFNKPTEKIRITPEGFDGDTFDVHVLAT